MLYIRVYSDVAAATRTKLLSVSLTVLARTSFAAWASGDESDATRMCKNASAASGAYGAVTIGAVQYISFQLCDHERLPLARSMPNSNDVRSIIAKWSESPRLNTSTSTSTRKRI